MAAVADDRGQLLSNTGTHASNSSQSTSTTTTSARLAAATSPEFVDSSQQDVQTVLSAVEESLTTGEPTTLHFAIGFEHFQAIHDLLEEHPRRPAIHLCYYDGAIIITLNPTGPHENAHLTLGSIIKTFVANAHPNGLPGHDALIFLGAKSHFSQIEAISLQGDSVLAPLVSPNGPTLVIECGHSPTDPSLPIRKMDAWFRGFPTVLAVILININDNIAGSVDIQTWQRHASLLGRSLHSTTVFTRGTAPTTDWFIPWNLLYPPPQPAWAVGPALVVPTAHMQQFHLEFYSVFT
ncbi:hypothetical protein DFH06DRAFT_1202079 [Mycena polygramma]|nr:hypothetical protein DFH06DRAFT_1202079 [Mycena polygramma]